MVVVLVVVLVEMGFIQWWRWWSWCAGLPSNSEIQNHLLDLMVQVVPSTTWQVVVVVDGGTNYWWRWRCWWWNGVGPQSGAGGGSFNPNPGVAGDAC